MLCSGPHRYRLFFNLGIFRPQGSHVLPNGSSAGLDGVLPKILKDLTAKSNGQTGLIFLKALTNLVNVILEVKVLLDIRPYFFGAKLIALKKPDGGPRPIALCNTFRRLSAKCAGYHVFESRQARYGSRQVGVGTKRGAELASHVFPCLMESPQPKGNIIWKIDFENFFNSINRQFMPEKTFEIHPEVYKYSHSAYCQPSFLFFFTVIQLSNLVKGPSKKILSLQLYFRIPFRI